MVFDDFAAYCQPHTAPFILLKGMKPPEKHEDLIKEAGFDADAVIVNSDDPHVIPALSGDANLGRQLFFSELDGVSNQVLKELTELHVVTFHHRQLPAVEL